MTNSDSKLEAVLFGIVILVVLACLAFFPTITGFVIAAVLAFLGTAHLKEVEEFNWKVSIWFAVAFLFFITSAIHPTWLSGTSTAILELLSWLSY